MWPKFGYSSICIREVIITSISQWFDQKNSFFEGWSWFKFNNLWPALDTNLKFYISVLKGSKLKVRKFWELIPTFVEVKGEKLVGGDPLCLSPSPILNRVKAVFKYKNHWSIVSIRCLSHRVSNFNFSCIDKNKVLKKTTKTSQDNDLTVKVLKENADYFSEFICIQFNDSVNSSKFPSSFKCANITPIFKNESRNYKTNCSPLSILPMVSKIFEKNYELSAVVVFWKNSFKIPVWFPQMLK